MAENRKVSSEREKQLKRCLEVWREAVLPIHALLVWEKPWYPGLLCGLSSAFFLLFWYWDPSVLTTVGFLGLVITVGDYAVRFFGSRAVKPDTSEKWTGKDEKKLEEVCHNIASMQMLIASSVTNFFQMRYTHTKTYFATSISALLVLSWLGSVINNLFLTYLIVTLALLLPGMKHQGILQHCMSAVMSTVGQAFKGEAKPAAKKSE